MRGRRGEGEAVSAGGEGGGADGSREGTEHSNREAEGGRDEGRARGEGGGRGKGRGRWGAKRRGRGRGIGRAVGDQTDGLQLDFDEDEIYGEDLRARDRRMAPCTLSGREDDGNENQERFKSGVASERGTRRKRDLRERCGETEANEVDMAKRANMRRRQASTVGQSSATSGAQHDVRMNSACELAGLVIRQGGRSKERGNVEHLSLIHI